MPAKLPIKEGCRLRLSCVFPLKGKKKAHVTSPACKDHREDLSDG